MKEIKNLLGNINELWDKSLGEDGKPYTHPKLKNLGTVNIVLLREAIAPVVFRNAEEEITDIEIDDQVYVRAVPNKFKYPERSRGLQILRAMDAGGNCPQNRTSVRGKIPSEAFDMNALVFGDSSSGKSVYPVKAAVNYSDALSFLPKINCVEETMHIRAMEDGTLFYAKEEKQESSKHLFPRHFIRPGTLMVQVLSTRGKLLPMEGLDHLLLCLGIAGTYGGQTSVTGTNIRTHIVGVYGAKFEPEQGSPYVLIEEMKKQEPDLTNQAAMENWLHEIMKQNHQISIDGKATRTYQADLIKRFEDDDKSLKDAYQHAKEKVGEFFNAWFSGVPEGKKLT
ncbi:MAG: type I-D CRISPR-associated protein Csc2 [Desulfobacteraceae bacterium]|nr:type I-D CRISPR-associated protein Csc2 [Desulfobacteraceae bacterium]